MSIKMSSDNSATTLLATNNTSNMDTSKKRNADESKLGADDSKRQRLSHVADDDDEVMVDAENMVEIEDMVEIGNTHAIADDVWKTGKGSEKKIFPLCIGDKFLFARNKKIGWEYAALTWLEVYNAVMEGWNTQKYCNIFQHRNSGTARGSAMEVYGGVGNFLDNLPCVLYFDIDDIVANKEDHNRVEYLEGLKQAVSDVLGINEPMRVQNSCGEKNEKYKVSYHVLFPSVHFSSLFHLKEFLKGKGCEKKGNWQLPGTPYIFDPAVYYKGNWRLPYCVKLGQDRVMVPDDVVDMTFQAFKELSIHHIPSDSVLMEVKLDQSKTTVKQSETKSSSMTTLEETVGSDIDQLKRYLLRHIDDINSVDAIFDHTVRSDGCLEIKTYSKLCSQIKSGCHKQNHVNYIVGRCGIRQSCYDEDCWPNKVKPPTEWTAWPSPRPNFVNHLFFARPPQKEIVGNRVIPPEHDKVFLDWTMTGQAIEPATILSGDVVPDFFYNAPFDLYASDIYGFLKIRDIFSGDGWLPTIPDEYMQLSGLHNEWLQDMKSVVLAKGNETYFIVICLMKNQEGTKKKVNYLQLLRRDPQNEVLVNELKSWREDKLNIPILEMFTLFKENRTAMLGYYCAIKERIATQVNPLISSGDSRQKRRIYDVLISAGVDVQFGEVVEGNMLLKLLLHIVKKDRWARMGVESEDKPGRLRCRVLKYNAKSHVYEGCYGFLDDFCRFVLQNLAVDFHNTTSTYLSNNPRIMPVLLRNLTQKWAPLQPDRRYVSFKDGIYDRFHTVEESSQRMGKFLLQHSEEYQKVIENTNQDIYRFFDVPWDAGPDDTWEFANPEGLTVADMAPKYSGAQDTEIDEIFKFQGKSAEDSFVLWANIGRSMIGLMHKGEKIDGLKISLYFDGESDTGKTVLLDIISHAHPDEQIGTFSTEKNFPLATAAHSSLIVNHESRTLQVGFTTWKNVCEGQAVPIVIKYGAAKFEVLDAMVAGAGNGICQNYPDTGGSKTARIVHAKFEAIVTNKDSSLLVNAQKNYGKIMHKGIGAYWKWLEKCVKKGTWYESLSQKSGLYTRETKSRHHLLDQFIFSEMNVIGFKDRIDESFCVTRGIPNIKLTNPRAAPANAPDNEPRLTLADFADLYYKWLVDKADNVEDFENPYEDFADCVSKCFNTKDKKLNSNLGQNFFWTKYYCVFKKNKLGSKTRGEHVIYGMSAKPSVLYSINPM